MIQIEMDKNKNENEKKGNINEINLLIEIKWKVFRIALRLFGFVKNVSF